MVDEGGEGKLTEYEEWKLRRAEKKNVWQQKLDDIQQSNEFTSIDRHQEAYCYICLRRDWASPVLMDVCIRCASKRAADTILAVTVRKPAGFCMVHGDYAKLDFPRNNVAQLNVRLCVKCNDRVSGYQKRLREMGTHRADPFWRYLRRQQGKDYFNIMRYGIGSR